MTFHGRTFLKQVFRFPVLAFLFATLTATAAPAAETDVNSWNVLQYNHRWNDRWSGQLQYEIRLQNDLKDVDERIYKPSVRYHFNENLSLGIGFKFIDRPASDEVNDKDPWQELTYKHVVNGYNISHSSRLEQRFRDDFTGILPRIRYVFAVSKPINSEWNWAASNEIRFNLDDKDVGPINGFEQNRLYGGLGYKINDRTKFEFGYLWRYERQRVGSNDSDHDLRMQFVYSTDARKR